MMKNVYNCLSKDRVFATEHPFGPANTQFETILNHLLVSVFTFRTSLLPFLFLWLTPFRICDMITFHAISNH